MRQLVRMKKRGFLVVFLLFGLGIFTWFRFLAPVSSDSTKKIVSFSDDTAKILVVQKLRLQGLIRSELMGNLILNKNTYLAGGYELSDSMNILEINKVMASGPQLLWVVVPPGWRKEQLAEKLKVKFNWTNKDVTEFEKGEEGTYFPDTYLIPRGESGKQIGARMFANFNEKFAPYAQKFLEKNIRNDTVLKIASLVQRESGGDDMPIISGIIWNRLNRGMGLKIDATVQYAKGEVNGNWWSRVSVADYSGVDSLYNTYEYKGLPPTPIASPGLPAIDAVLNSKDTDCLYYLHDSLGQIHCSPTYEGHLENVEKYLR